MFKTSLGRGVALSISLIAALNAGCSSDSEPSAPPPSTSSGAIALWLDLGGDAVEPTGQLTTTARVLRSGGFLGDVEFSVSGAPAGVVVTIADVQTTGAITLATIIVTTAATAPLGVHSIVVHARGLGVSEVTARYQLTVRAPLVRAYSMWFESSALHVVKEDRNNSVRLILSRTNFLGKVALTAENLPPGITAEFTPSSAESFSFLILTAADSAPLGTFSNVIVRGVAEGLEDRTLPVSVTISSRGFGFTLGAQTLTIVRGGVSTIDLTVVRTSYLGPVSFGAEWRAAEDHFSLPAGVTFTFAPASTTGLGTVLTIRVSPSANPGTYVIDVGGEGLPGTWCSAPPLTLVITPT